jgi:hypothetical protein
MPSTRLVSIVVPILRLLVCDSRHLRRRRRSLSRHLHTADGPIPGADTVSATRRRGTGAHCQAWMAGTAGGQAGVRADCPNRALYGAGQQEHPIEARPVDRPRERWPGRQVMSAATPVIFDTACVVEMLDWIERHRAYRIDDFFRHRWRLDDGATHGTSYRIRSMQSPPRSGRASLRKSARSARIALVTWQL